MSTKRTGKPIFFVILALILALTFFAFFGLHNYYGDTKKVYFKGANDIRWGIDISGGVEAVFSPDKKGVEITSGDMDSAKTIIESRLVSLGITDYEVETDKSTHQVIVRFPRTAGDGDFDPQKAIDILSADAQLEFYAGSDNSSGTPFMTGDAVKEADVAYDTENGHHVNLELNSKGTQAFANATTNAFNNGSQISIYMDGAAISTANVKEPITTGDAIITGQFTAESAKLLADQINGGALPFALTPDDSKLQIISPTLGSNALDVMLIAGAIAFGLICILMIALYRVNGVVASIALLGQVAGSIACISGFIPGAEGFTLTVPGIAGIILSIGVGVDCNVIAAERIKDEFKKGKTIDGAIDSGFKNSLSAIIDGNVTIIIVALVLMGAFGAPSDMLAKIFSPIMNLFGASIAGSIYSFGYTLLVGVIFNLIMGVLASKYMLKSLSGLKFMRNPALYGGKKNV
ncbi:MAG: protein translocase subunit SecD [Clostridia bacterium]|nr:protein translocase subunit SecD [Clostridia bacterium]